MNNPRQLLTRLMIVAFGAVAVFIGWTMANNATTRGEFKARMEAEKDAGGVR